MRTIDTTAAVGTVLVHDLTRIVKDVAKETIFRKGHVVKAEDVPILLSMGRTRLHVWEPEPGAVHENEAVEILADAAGFRGLFDLTAAKEGKIEIAARESGIFLVDLARLDELNDLDDITLAVRHSGVQVKSGDVLAGLKVIPLALPASILERAKAILSRAPMMAVKPFVLKTAAIIATGSEIFHGRVKDEFTAVVEGKLAEYGVKVVYKTVRDDKTPDIVEAIKATLAAGAQLITCTGGMSVDPDDLTPGAIKAAGAEVVSRATPALPGAVLMVAYLGDVPILGLPGCVMFGKRTVLDVILPRIAAGLKVTRKEIRRLGQGGLCLSCPVCVFPACGFGRGVPYPL